MGICFVGLFSFHKETPCFYCNKQGVACCLSSGGGSCLGRLSRAWARLWAKARSQGRERRFRLVTFSFRLKCLSFCSSSHTIFTTEMVKSLPTRARKVRSQSDGFTPIIYSTDSKIAFCNGWEVVTMTRKGFLLVGST